MCINQNNRRMKTILLVVGRTVEQHYITAINDYIQRTKRYITFDMEVIPELTYIIHSGFISGYQNRYGDNLKPPTNVYHRMTA